MGWVILLLIRHQKLGSLRVGAIVTFLSSSEVGFLTSAFLHRYILFFYFSSWALLTLELDYFSLG